MLNCYGLKYCVLFKTFVSIFVSIKVGEYCISTRFLSCIKRQMLIQWATRFVITVKSKSLGRQVAQSVECRTLEVEVPGSKPALGTSWWDWISPNQPYPKGAAPAATTPLNEW